MPISKFKKQLKGFNRECLPFVLAGFITGSFTVLSFPPYSLWPLAFVTFVPLILSLFHATRWQHAFSAGFAATFTSGFWGFHWVSYVATSFGGLPWIVSKFVLVLFSLFGEFQFLMFALLTYAILKRVKQAASGGTWLVLLGLPCLYVGLDFSYPKIFPTTLGHVFYGWFTVVQMAEFFGAFGFTFCAVLSGAAIAVLIQKGFSTSKRLPKLKFSARSQPAFFVLVFLGIALGMADLWGSRRIGELGEIQSHFSRLFKFSVIQANIGDVDKLASEHGIESAVRKVLYTYRSESLKTVAHHHPDLVVWPETAYPLLYTHFSDENANRSGAAKDKWLVDLVQELKTPIFFGGYSQVRGRDYNSAFLVKPPEVLVGLYRKSILLAFGEYVPLGPFGPYIQEIVPTIADFGRGQGPMIMDLDGVKLAPEICYEGIVPEHVRGGARLGADLLINITNDSWFGNTSEPHVHLMLTLFRAIELRRPFLRATNTGISTLADITGKKMFQSPLFAPATIESQVRLPDASKGEHYPETFYLQFGEVFGFGTVWVLFALLTRYFGAEGLMIVKRALRFRKSN